MPADHRRIFTICIAFCLLSVPLVWWLGAVGLAIALTGALGIVLGVVRDEMHRLTRRMNEAFRQTEATISLHAAVAPRLPLPPMRGWAMSPDMAGLVFATVLEKKPRVVVELGSGVSTLITAYALERLGEGRLISLDHDAQYARASSANVRRHQLEDRVRIVHAPLTTHQIDGATYRWYETSALDEIDAIDVLVVDGPVQAHNPQPMVRFPALPLLLDKLAPDAVVLVDDARRQQDAAVVARWQELYPEFEVRSLPTETGSAILERRPVAAV